MHSYRPPTSVLSMVLVALLGFGCGDDSSATDDDTTTPDASTRPPDGATEPATSAFALASVVIDAEGARTTYVQAIDSLESGPFDNETAIEIPGNGVVIAGGGDFFVGLTEEPTWVRYSLGEDGVEETGRVSFLSYGVSRIDYGNAYVDDTTAVSVLSSAGVAVFWNPRTMEILGDVDISHLARDGYDLEVWTTAAKDGRVYIPGRWANWDEGRIYGGVSMTIIDAATRTLIGTAEDDRCASGGRVSFDEDGYAYVMGDGRNYSVHMFANARGDEAPPPNCLLRIAPGATDFEEDYYYAIPDLTGGPESISELQPANAGAGYAFSLIFHEDQLPEGVEPVDFTFWSVPAHKMWRFTLGDPPVLEEVEGAPFSVIGFTPVAFDGRLYSGISDTGATSDVYELDPVTNSGRVRFTMDGFFAGLYELN